MKKTYVHLALVAALAVAVYANSFAVPFLFDDDLIILRDLDIRSFELSPMNRRYVGQLTFAINFALGETDVTGYHLVNLIIHIANAILLYSLVVITFRTPFLESSGLREKSRALALSAALLFAVHPVQTQAVTYIVQRLASLATLFYLLTVILYAKSRLSAERSKAVSFYVMAVLSAVLAMKTKELAATLPLAVAMYEFLFFRDRLSRRLRYLAPVLALILVVPLTLVSLGVSPSEMLREAATATRLHTDMPRAVYLLTEFRVLLTYVRLLFLPVNQTLDYDYPVYTSFLEPAVLTSFVILALLFLAGVYFLLVSRRGEPAWRLMSFGVFWFFLTISVESSVIPIVDVIYEHRLYLPSVGAFTALGTGAFLLLRPASPRKARAAALLLAAVILALSAGAIHRNTAWQSEKSLWQDVVRKAPGKARGYNNLGLAYDKEGDLDTALAYYLRAIQINPAYSDAYNNLGNAYLDMGMEEKAKEFFALAMKKRPEHAGAHYNLGLRYYEEGKYELAMEHLKKSLKRDPSFVDTYHLLGNIYRAQGNIPEAIRRYEKALAIDPDIAEIHYTLGIIYGPRGEVDKALEHLEAAARLRPDFAPAHQNLGNAYMAKGRPAKAMEQYLKALELDPENAQVHYNLSTAYRNMGLDRKAEEHLRKARLLDPTLGK